MARVAFESVGRGPRITNEPRITFSPKGRIMLNKLLAEKIGLPCRMKIEFETDTNELFFTKDEKGALTISKTKTGGIVTSVPLTNWLKSFGITSINFKGWDNKKQMLICQAVRQKEEVSA